MATQTFTTGSVYAFELEALKDGVVWDITGAAVSLWLTDPAGTEAEKTATVTDGPAGLAAYTTLETDFDRRGTWLRQWCVGVGGVVQWWTPQSFWVEQGA